MKKEYEKNIPTVWDDHCLEKDILAVLRQKLQHVISQLHHTADQNEMKTLKLAWLLSAFCGKNVSYSLALAWSSPSREGDLLPDAAQVVGITLLTKDKNLLETMANAAGYTLKPLESPAELSIPNG